jgi:hypothetical protein
MAKIGLAKGGRGRDIGGRRMRFCLLAIIACLSVLLAGREVEAKGKFAFVIGASPEGERPYNNADLMSATLVKLGYKVDLLRNLSSKRIRSVFRGFLEKIPDEAADVVIFYSGIVTGTADARHPSPPLYMHGSETGPFRNDPACRAGCPPLEGIDLKELVTAITTRRRQVTVLAIVDDDAVNRRYGSFAFDPYYKTHYGTPWLSDRVYLYYSPGYHEEMRIPGDTTRPAGEVTSFVRALTGIILQNPDKDMEFVYLAVSRRLQTDYADRSYDQSPRLPFVTNHRRFVLNGRGILTRKSEPPVIVERVESQSVATAPERKPPDAVDPAASRAAIALPRSGTADRLGNTYSDGSYALLVGVSDYAETADKSQPWDDLPSIGGEVKELADVLEKVHGFTVKLLLDPAGAELKSRLESFVREHGHKQNARLLVFMAGHGWTTETHGRKTAWFVPSDAPGIDAIGAFRESALNLRRVEEWSEVMESKHVLWIFDSCFSGAALKMYGSRSATAANAWADHLLTNPVRRVFTAGSEHEKVPAESIFTRRLIDALSGQAPIATEDGILTGDALGEFLRRDIIRTYKREGVSGTTPQNDTIVIPGEEGDVVFRIEPEIASQWRAAR